MTILGVTEHFSGKNGTLRWSILVGKQKHNVQRPTYMSLQDRYLEIPTTTILMKKYSRQKYAKYLVYFGF